MSLITNAIVTANYARIEETKEGVDHIRTSPNFADTCHQGEHHLKLVLLGQRSHHEVNDNEKEEGNIPNLQVLRACALISAESHDLQKFDPAFLVSSLVVSEEWPCTRYRRLPRRVEIEFDSGLVRWRMTERELWIEMFPEVSWDLTMSSHVPQLIPHFAKGFLTSLPQLAAPDISFHWEIAVGKPEPEKWLRDNFGPRALPSGYEMSDITASFVAVKDDLQVRLDVEIEESDDEDDSKPNSLIFDCFASPRLRLSRDQLETETERWVDYADAVRAVMAVLLEGDQRDDVN